MKSNAYGIVNGFERQSSNSSRREREQQKNPLLAIAAAFWAVVKEKYKENLLRARPIPMWKIYRRIGQWKENSNWMQIDFDNIEFLYPIVEEIVTAKSRTRFGTALMKIELLTALPWSRQDLVVIDEVKTWLH